MPRQATRPPNPFDCDLFEYVIYNNQNNGRLPDANRGSWYCPTVTEKDAKLVARMADEYEINRIYDCGAGDLRLSIWLSRRGYDVVAYETISGITDTVGGLFNLSDIDLRNRDYHADWRDIHDDRAVFVAFGKMNHLPGEPTNGIGIDRWPLIADSKQ